jgi:hypothetical protein
MSQISTNPTVYNKVANTYAASMNPFNNNQTLFRASAAIDKL